MARSPRPFDTSPSFSQPVRQIVMMLIVSVLVGAGIYVIYGRIFSIFQTNPFLNGVILGVFVLGAITCFWQVVTLVGSVSWIEGFVADRPGHEITQPPGMLAPLAALLRGRGAGRSISTSSARSILESVAARIEEARDITRYLASLLIFLGLLGTFYGLSTTVPAVVETIRALAPKPGESSVDVFTKLMSGLESQLGGMGTAFSSSLMGLAGSLVIGLLELFASHGQNRFYRELEDWLSSITRLGLGGGEGETLDQATIIGVLDHMGAQMETLQAVHAQTEAGNAMIEARLAQLAEAIAALAARPTGADWVAPLQRGQADLARAQDRVAAGQEQLAEVLMAGQARAAEAQDQLIAALTARPAPVGGPLPDDAEARMRLRSIDVQLLRILEELAAGRQEAIADLRADIAALTRAVRQSAGHPARLTGRGDS